MGKLLKTLLWYLLVGAVLYGLFWYFKKGGKQRMKSRHQPLNAGVSESSDTGIPSGQGFQEALPGAQQEEAVEPSSTRAVVIAMPPQLPPSGTGVEEGGDFVGRSGTPLITDTRPPVTRKGANWMRSRIKKKML